MGMGVTLLVKSFATFLKYLDTAHIFVVVRSSVIVISTCLCCLTPHGCMRAKLCGDLPFAASLSEFFHVGPRRSQSHIGLATFASVFREEFGLRAYDSNALIKAAILNTSYNAGLTNMYQALNKSLSMFPTNGNDKRVLVVVTNGMPTIHPLNITPVVQRLQHALVVVFAVGISHDVTQEYLQSLSLNNNYQAESASQLTDLLASIVDDVCALQAISTVTTTSTTQTSTLSCEELYSDHPICNQFNPSDCVDAEVSNACPKLCLCRSTTLDVVAVLDASDSVGVIAWDDYMLPFVNDLSKRFRINDNETRFGVGTFSTDFVNAFDLDEYNTNVQVSAAINLVEYSGGLTNTYLALTNGSNVGFTHKD
eukprot:m.104960 g.104960  ORF g.104960 m.104960 type:complete len:367 (-) comp13864_c0_seq1:292-1392(-)